MKKITESLNSSENFRIKKLKILFLGPDNPPQNAILEFLFNDGNSVTRQETPFKIEDIYKSDFYFLISFGYRYLVTQPVLNYFQENAINLHISYLPWNKGADPNLWSILENTPKGVTIHQMDFDLDEGKILYQREIKLHKDDTLKSSYDKLHTALVELFMASWENIKNNKVRPTKQSGTGTFHVQSEKDRYLELLSDGWDTKVVDLEGRAIDE